MSKLPDRMTPVQMLTELANHFRVFHKAGTEEEKMWFRSMDAVLAGYEPSVLATACFRIMRSRKDTRFPVPAEITAVCDEVLADRSREKLIPNAAEARDKAPAWTEERRRLADELVMCEMGRRAAREDWIGALHDFARREMRLPAPHEIAGVRRAAQDFDQHYDDVMRGGAAGEATAALARLGHTISARREQLRTKLLGENAQ